MKRKLPMEDENVRVRPILFQNRKKRKLSENTQVSKWKQVPYENSTRKDKLKIMYWKKLNNDKIKSKEIKETPYSLFGRRKIKVFSYTDEEYEKHLRNIGTTQDFWTKEQTDELFNLCREFDLRFPVIYDRLSFREEKDLETVKNRYFSISGKLLEIRSRNSNVDYHPINVTPYDYDQEVERKKILQSFFLRPEFVDRKAHNIEQRFKCVKKKKEVIEEELYRKKIQLEEDKELKQKLQLNVPLTKFDINFYKSQSESETDKKQKVYVRSDLINQKLDTIQYKVETKEEQEKLALEEILRDGFLYNSGKVEEEINKLNNFVQQYYFKTE